MNEYLDADRPIESRDEDRLGRRAFAEAMARHAAAVPVAHGFTMAVLGAWGSGKTSVLNMIAEAMVERDMPAVLRFNPWLFSTANDLLPRFFEELSSQLGQQESNALRRAATVLGEFGQALSETFLYQGPISFRLQFAELHRRKPCLGSRNSGPGSQGRWRRLTRG